MGKESKMYENLKTMALDESVFKLVHSYSSHIWKYPQNANISSKPTRVEEMAAESIMYECLMLFQVSVVLGQSIDGIGGLLNTLQWFHSGVSWNSMSLPSDWVATSHLLYCLVLAQEYASLHVRLSSAVNSPLPPLSSKMRELQKHVGW